VPEFDGDALAAKYAGLRGTPLTPAQESAWRRIEELAAPFHAADKLLFGVPLWNFGIPYKLKHLIDVISQKDVLFTFDGIGFAGKLTGKKAAVVYARAGLRVAGIVYAGA
jgi:FMN-dependent NADH-azoreductase